MKYAEPAETSKLLIQGIETLVGADLVSNLEDDLALLKKNILKDTSPDLQSELSETENKIQEVKKNIEKDNNKLQKIIQKNAKAKQAYEDIEIKFRAKGIKTFAKVEKLESSILDLKAQIEILKKEQVLLISGVLPLKLAKKNIASIRKLSKKLSLNLSMR